MTSQGRSPRLVLAGIGLALVAVLGSLLATTHAGGAGRPGAVAPRTPDAAAGPTAPGAQSPSPGTGASAGSGTLPGSGASPTLPPTAAGLASIPPTQEPAPLPTPTPPDIYVPVAAGPAPTATVRPVLDTAAGRDVAPPVGLPARVELYAGQVSVVPGQPLQLHVSTPAAAYALSVARQDPAFPGGQQVVATTERHAGRDYRALATYDNVTRTARANWPVTDELGTGGWAPGVYIVTATDSGGAVGRAIVVVRNEVLVPGQPVFVFTALTYQAYNLWGGSNFYTYAGPRADRVSFERPYEQGGGRGFWAKGDDRMLAWLQRRAQLQFTTDYDLSVAPPAVVPRLLVFPRHTEYVPGTLRDWLEEHVETLGYPNVLSYGANGFYWQVRLAAPRTPGAPLDVVCYKSAATDPEAAAWPALATVRWQDAPVSRPEGALIGSQFAEVVADGYRRYDLTVTADAPGWLLDGTGWAAGTTLRGLLTGEADAPWPGSGAVAVLAGTAPDPGGHPIWPASTLRVSPAGARIFNAGTFGWSDGLGPAVTSLGVTPGSFDRFNENLLAWLGFPVPR